MSNILNFKWDVLIVLDAARYDYFSSVINYFASGKLIRIKSLGSCTLEWLYNTFREKYDNIVYISGNPFVNKRYSFGDKIRFEPYKHFRSENIFELFRKCWKYPGTTEPICFTINASKILIKHHNRLQHNREVKFIIHYLQPHAPYLDYSYPYYERNPIAWAKSSSRHYMMNRSKLYRKALHVYSIFEKILIDNNFPNIPLYNLRQIIGFPPPYPTEEFRRLYGIRELRKAYLHNMVRVLLASLAFAKFLQEEFDLNVAFTSDHGEGLGDNSWIDHPCCKDFDFLRNVFIFYPDKIKIFDKTIYYKLKLLFKLHRKLPLSIQRL